MKKRELNDSEALRDRLKKSLGIPARSYELSPDFRGQIHHDNLIVEKWIWKSEPGSLVTSLLYRPAQIEKAIPAMVITNGHGGSKTSGYTKYAAQLYAKLGMACLVHDTIGEEERHMKGQMGTRAHDDRQADQRAMNSGRTMMGKMIFDTIRAIDFLCTREDVDCSKLGVAGNSLGGAIAGFMAGLDPRVKLALVSGFGFGKTLNEMQKKLCTLTASRKLLEICSYPQFFTACASHCNILVMNGLEDVILTKGKNGVWDETRDIIDRCSRQLAEIGALGSMSNWFHPDGGHRAYHLHKDALLWIYHHFRMDGWNENELKNLPHITLGEWYKKFAIEYTDKYREIYWNQLHHKGTELVDLDITPIPPEKLACLNANEIGQAEYTLEGWLQAIETKR